MWYTFCAKPMILIDRIVTLRGRSPCRERGLKSFAAALVRRRPSSLTVQGAWIEIERCAMTLRYSASLPVQGAWIEITMWSSRWKSAQSLPVQGAWIEITICARRKARKSSRSPCRERGLKSYVFACGSKNAASLPVQGAWIEIGWELAGTSARLVAPRAGSVD